MTSLPNWAGAAHPKVKSAHHAPTRTPSPSALYTFSCAPALPSQLAPHSSCGTRWRMVGRRSSSLFVFFVFSLAAAFALDKKMNCSTDNEPDRYTLDEDGFKWSMDESKNKCASQGCSQLPELVDDVQSESLIKALSSIKDDKNESSQFLFWLGLKRDEASVDGKKWLDPHKWKWVATSQHLVQSIPGGNWSSIQGEGPVSKTSEEECVLAEWNRNAQSFVWIRAPCHENETSKHIPAGPKKILVCQCCHHPGMAGNSGKRSGQEATEGDTPIWIWIVVGVVGVVCVAGVLAGVLIYRRRQRAGSNDNVSTDVKARRSKLSEESSRNSGGNNDADDDTLNAVHGFASPEIVYLQRPRRGMIKVEKKKEIKGKMTTKKSTLLGRA